MSFISCNGRVIHYRYSNNNSDQTFLFINSLGTDFRIWDEVVNDLKPLDGCLARTEVVPADQQKATAGLYLGFRRGTVRLARLAIFRRLEA